MVDFIPGNGKGNAASGTRVKVFSHTKLTATIPRENGAIYRSGSQAEVVVEVPYGTCGQGCEHVHTSNTLPFSFLVHIGSISPNSSGPAGGGSITITGSGFGPAGTADSVYFSPTNGVGDSEGARNMKVRSNTKITATIPKEGHSFSGSGGHVEVSVSVPYGRCGTNCTLVSPSNSVPFNYTP